MDLEDSSNEESPLLASREITQYSRSSSSSPRDESSTFEATIYTKRWYMLAVFSLIAFAQGLLWNNWSPLGDTMLIGFGWEASFLAFSLALSNLSIVLFAFPTMYLVETRGLRLGAILAAASLALGTAMWNIALTTQQKWIICIGSIAVGLPNCVSLAGAPLLSVLWFPVSERTTATAFATMSTFVGVGLSFVSGPLISAGKVTESDVKNKDNMTEEEIQDIKNGVYRLVYVDTALAVLCFILVMVHFPTKPPSPPSRAQTNERIDYWSGVKQMVKNYNFWILNMAYNIAGGTYNAWLPLMSVTFSGSLGMDETAAGMIGFASIMAGCVGSVAIAYLADRFKRNTKRFLQIMVLCAIACFTILSCIQEGFILIDPKYCTAVVYILSMAIAVCMIGGVPLYYELGCEITYPVYEGLSCTFITVVNDCFGLLFYALFLVPALAQSTTWMTWVCLACCVFSFPMLVLLKENYNRLNVEVDG